MARSPIRVGDVSGYSHSSFTTSATTSTAIPTNSPFTLVSIGIDSSGQVVQTAPRYQLVGRLWPLVQFRTRPQPSLRRCAAPQIVLSSIPSSVPTSRNSEPSSSSIRRPESPDSDFCALSTLASRSIDFPTRSRLAGFLPSGAFACSWIRSRSSRISVDRSAGSAVGPVQSNWPTGAGDTRIRVVAVNISIPMK